MRNPLVTIAIPTYNRADSYLKHTLECAINQTYENIEILVSDNCSTDHTEELVKSYRDQRITYFKQKTNLGQRGNSNFLLDQANGEYFHMFHDDDSIDPDFIEICMEKAKYRTGLGIIMSGSRMIDENNHTIQENRNETEGLSLEEFILSWYEYKMNIFLCCTLFGTSTLKEIGGFEEKYNRYDDVAANWKCTREAGRVDVPDVKAGLRSHSGSVTSTTDIEMWSRDALTLLDLAFKLAPGKVKEIQNIGMRQSAKNMYIFASEEESKLKRIKSFWKIYSLFGYKFLPPFKHCNEIVPMTGYVLHPYHGMSKLKSVLQKNLTQQSR